MASQVEAIKKIPGTPFMVDGFAFATVKCAHYFLTHCHSDHTIGLRRKFELGHIYCTPVSARILALDFGLRPPVVVPLQLNVRVVIEGIGVTPLDANHCPGACMFMFEVPGANGGVTRVLHTGDCRWVPQLYHGSCLSSLPVDVLYLDTTYAKPSHTFPSQQEAIQGLVEGLRQVLAQEPHTLIAMAAYHIGKERAFFGAAQALDFKIYVDPSKARLLKQLDLPEQDLARLTSQPALAQLHVSSWGSSPERLQQLLQEAVAAGAPWNAIVGVRATGWCYRRSKPGAHLRRVDSSCWLLEAPYSEHSSWTDLRGCVAALRPRRIVPTVNAPNAAAAGKLVDLFADLMDLRSSRRHIDRYLCRSPAPAATGKLQDVEEATTTTVAAAAAAAITRPPVGVTAAAAPTSTAAAESQSAAEPGTADSAIHVLSGVPQPAAGCNSRGGQLATVCATAAYTSCLSSAVSSATTVLLSYPGAAAPTTAGPPPVCPALQRAPCNGTAASTTPFAAAAAVTVFSQQQPYKAQLPTAVLDSSAVAAAAGTSGSASADICGGSPSTASPGPSLSTAAAVLEESVNLAEVDIAEQQRIMDELQRRQRLKHSLQLQQAAKKRQRATAGGRQQWKARA